MHLHTSAQKCFVSYRHVKPDEDLAQFLVGELEKAGFTVFFDQKIAVGTRWAKEIQDHIEQAHHFIVLLSEAAIASDMVREEILFAHKLSIKRDDFHIYPVRVGFEGALPYDIAACLNPIQYLKWNPGVSFTTVYDTIFDAIKKPEPRPESDPLDTAGCTLRNQSDTGPDTATTAPLPLADPTGAVRLDSPFYITRDTDALAMAQIKLQGTVTIIKGPRQMGKTSLLARLHHYASEQSIKTCYIDFQLIDERFFGSLEMLLRYLAEKLSHSFPASVTPQEQWDDFMGAKDNLSNFIETAYLQHDGTKLLFLLDEVDRLFGYSFRDDFFGMVRGWYNLCAINPLWNSLNVVIAHSTEPQLWIQDLNQSPFNIGTQIPLQEFTVQQIAELNARCGTPLKHEDDISSLVNLIGGHPYLVRKAFYSLVSNTWEPSMLLEKAYDDNGPFGDHLRRYLWCLSKDIALMKTFRALLQGRECTDETHFQRLKAVGLCAGDSRRTARPRCQLYYDYFSGKL